MATETEHEFSIRQARPDDVPALTALVNSAYRGERALRGWTTETQFLEGQRTDEEQIRSIVTSKQGVIFVAESSRAIGCAHVKDLGGGIAYFGMLSVDPDLQTRGTGSALLAACEDQARRVWKCAVIEMTVISLRRELIEYYERRGYRRSGERRPFPYGNERFGRPLREDLEFEVLTKTI